LLFFKKGILFYSSSLYWKEKPWQRRRVTFTWVTYNINVSSVCLLLAALL